MRGSHGYGLSNHGIQCHCLNVKVIRLIDRFVCFNVPKPQYDYEKLIRPRKEKRPRNIPEYKRDSLVTRTML